MKWLELSIRVPGEYVEPMAELLRRYSRRSIAIEEKGLSPEVEPGLAPGPVEATLRAYLPMTASLRSSREQIRVGVQLISLLHPLPEMQERVLEDGEWEAAWKAHFTLLRVGRRVVLKPSWQAYAAGPEEVVVELDPGLAFGTGHHPTTRMCLEALERLAGPGMRVLDVGTGSGILAIAAAKLGAWRVEGLEIDPVGLRAARANVRANKVTRRVRLYRGSLPHPRVPEQGFDLALANLNARALERLAPHLAGVLKPRAFLVASGVLQEQLPQVERAFADAALIPQQLPQQGDWVTLILSKAPPREHDASLLCTPGVD